MAAEKPIGVGIIGLSAERGWAATAHLPALREVGGFEVVALSASSEESARAAADAHGVERAFGDHRPRVELPEVDLVVVTVRVPTHLELVGAAIAAGKDVFCEWPLALDLAEAEAMRDAAAAAHVRGFVGLQARSLPLLRFLPDYIAAGEIGEGLSPTTCRPRSATPSTASSACSVSRPSSPRSPRCGVPKSPSPVPSGPSR